MYLPYMALLCLAASATAVEAVACGCGQDYIGNNYGCGGTGRGQTYCQLLGVDGDYPVCDSSCPKRDLFAAVGS